MKLAVFGGSFNPIHVGHLLNASFASVQGGMDKVIFMPSGKHPFKDEKIFADAAVRLEMIEKAVFGDERFLIEDYELKNEGMIYTYDTMLYLKEKYPEDELYFLIGSDLLSELPLWHKIRELAKITTFLVANRQSSDTMSIDERREELLKNFGVRIKVVSFPYITVSSTEIRNFVKEGKSIRYLVPDSVREVIEEKRLYV